MPEENRRKRVWNPIARYYVEPLGDYIARLLKNTFVTPNMVTITHAIIGILASYLIWLGNYWLILFAIIVQLRYAFDLTDGQLARLKNMETKFGKFLDFVTDRVVTNIWAIAIILTLFFKENKLSYLFLGLLFIFGKYMHSYILLVTEKIYTNKEDKLKEDFKSNFLSKFFLLFIDNDINYHTLSFLALINKLVIYIWFYAFYYNIVWLMYLAYYGYRHIKLRGV